MLFSTTGLTRSTFELEADDGSPVVVPLVEDSEESDLLEDNIVCCVPLVVDEQEDEVEEVEGKEEEEEVEGRRYLLSFVEPELMERSRGNSWSRIFIALALKSILFRQEVGIFFFKETLVDKKKAVEGCFNLA